MESLRKRTTGQTHTRTVSGEDRGKDPGDASASQGMAKVTADKAQKEAPLSTPDL